MIGYGTIGEVDGVAGVEADGLRVEVNCGSELLVLEKLVGLGLQFFGLLHVLGGRRRGLVGRVILQRVERSIVGKLLRKQ